jgi:GntR family transcriptional regulator of vanillate catabolism
MTELDPSASGPVFGRPRPSDVASHTARVLFSLRELLLRGEFAPGERMSELRLAARLGVSRTPIRLALEQLAHIGLLDVSASGGFTVRGFTPSEALDAIELRGVLEGTAARLAAERLVDSSELDTLRRQGQEMEAFDCLTLDSFARYMELNEAFHTTMVALAKCDMLRRLLQHASSLPFASPSAMVFPATGLANADGALAIAKEHHRAIVAAIAKRQGARAESVAREHGLIGRRVLELALSDASTWSRVPGGSLINT